MFFGRAAGLGASLAKDVPFAALYWMMLEPMRGTLMEHDYSTLADSFWQNQNINELPGKLCCAGIGIIPYLQTPCLCIGRIYLVCG